MKKMTTLVLALSLLTTGIFAQEMAIDKKKSSVNWKGTKITGEHSGNINVKNGTVSMSEGALKAVDVTIDMTTIKCTDLGEGGAAKLESHLKNPDFFDVAKHETANFKSTSVNSTKGGYELTGDLTIKGHTEPVTFKCMVQSRGSAFNATGTLVFDRTKYGIKYGSGSFFEGLGDKTISDEVELKFNIVGAGK